MLTLGIETIVVLLVIMGAVCAVGGYAFAQARQRRAGGGKSADELKAELGAYKESVTDHFQTTATLLNGMTEQYRAVYQHMATGAQSLCDPDQATAQIENLAAAALPATIGEPIEHPEAEAEHSVEPPAAAPVDEQTGDKPPAADDLNVDPPADPAGSESAQAVAEPDANVETGAVDTDASAKDR